MLLGIISKFIMSSNEDPINKFVEELRAYFKAESTKIKKNSDDYTPEIRAMMLEMPEHLDACATEIGRIEMEAFAEFEAEKADSPDGIKNLSKAEIAQILDAKKRAKFNGSEIAKTLFTIACASEMKISQCLAFAEQCGVKDLSSFDSKTGLSPLVAVMLRRKNAVAAMKELERAGADIHAVSLQGNNIAHMAALFGVNKEVLDHLISSKVNFNLKNKNGMTPLDMAVGKRDLNFIKYLQNEAKAEFNFTPQKVRDTIADKIEDLERVRSVAARRKSTISKAENEIDEASERAINAKFSNKGAEVKFVVAPMEMGLRLEDTQDFINNKSRQSLTQQTTTDSAINNNIAQPVPVVDAKDREQRNKEQEARRGELQGEKLQELDSGIKTGFLGDFVSGITTLAAAVVEVGKVVEYVIEDGLREIKEIVQDELGIDDKDEKMEGGDKNQPPQLELVEQKLEGQSLENQLQADHQLPETQWQEYINARKQASANAEAGKGSVIKDVSVAKERYSSQGGFGSEKDPVAKEGFLSKVAPPDSEKQQSQSDSSENQWQQYLEARKQESANLDKDSASH